MRQNRGQHLVNNVRMFSTPCWVTFHPDLLFDERWAKPFSVEHFYQYFFSVGRYNVGTLAGFPKMWLMLLWVVLDDVETCAQQLLANNVGTFSRRLTLPPTKYWPTMLEGLAPHVGWRFTNTFMLLLRRRTFSRNLTREIFHVERLYEGSCWRRKPGIRTSLL